MMHPAIERTIETGYPFGEPVVYERCAHSSCREEIHNGEDVVEHADHLYCSKECLVDQMLEEGNANWVIAGE